MALNSKASALLGAIVLNTMFGQVTTVSHTAWSKTFTKCLKCPGATNTCGWDNVVTSHFRNSFNGNVIDAYSDFHETYHSVTFYFMKKDSKRCCDPTTPESIHNKDESKRGSAFAFIFGVN